MEEEDEMIRQMRKAKKTLNDIAAVMDWRTYAAIKFHALSLNTK
jgi:hypothetical protein